MFANPFKSSCNPLLVRAILSRASHLSRGSHFVTRVVTRDGDGAPTAKLGLVFGIAIAITVFATTEVAFAQVRAASSSPNGSAVRSTSPVIIDDPVTVLIGTSERHFKAGEHELEQGHFDAAKREFNLAVDVLLESPFGGRTEPRIREHFDRLVDRITAYEVRALASGDGFTEKT